MDSGKTKIGIVEEKNFPLKAIDILSSFGSVEFKKDHMELIDFINDKEVLFIRLKEYIDHNILRVAPKLKYICSPTTGLNHINEKDTEARGIKIISLKGEYDFLDNIRATPEHLLGLTLALLRKYSRCYLSETNKKWNRDIFIGNEIYNNSVGIIGMGRIGKIYAHYLTSMGAKVFFYDSMYKHQDVEQIYARVGSIEELICKTNIIALCASYSEDNIKMISKAHIEMMSDKFFINISRGELIDEKELLKKMKSGGFKGIALDVISDENNSNNLSFFIELTSKHTNFILTPHIGGATKESMEKTEIFIANKLKKLYF